ncbi:MAG: GNAT family N-acetyltransferase [Dehalococcoidia bacterium]
MRLEAATIEDVTALTALINLAYRKEDFFKIGDRTDEDDVRAHFATGWFIAARDDDGRLAGSVYVEQRGDAGYFGMLSVDPTLQNAGLGKRLVAEAEAQSRARGCTAMELEVVDLREELIPWYGRLGYRETGRAPFVPGKSRIPCEFIIMRRPLGDAEGAPS